jgi:hypothetical protein
MAAGNLQFYAALDAANRASIVDMGGIAPLVALVRDGDMVGKIEAARALKTLADDTAYQAAIVEKGGIAPLVALVGDGIAAGKAVAAGVLQSLVGNTAYHDAIVEEHGIAPLVALVGAGDAAGKSAAAAVLVDHHLICCVRIFFIKLCFIYSDERRQTLFDWM